jgi:3-hydroxybutyryl-CoA dehydrogenase
VSAASPPIAVAGAGRMGIGIALAFAIAGRRVDLLDLKERADGAAAAVLDRAAATAAEALAALGLDEPERDAAAGRIRFLHGAGAEGSLARAELVFECLPEILEAKRPALAQVGALAPGALIASTTSTFLADELAAHVPGPERFLNTHWLNPAFAMPLVEVSPAAATAPEATRRMVAALEAAGKVPVTMSPSPGFVVPRLQALVMNEAARMVAEGVASPEDIDRAARLGLGLRFSVLGPLEFVDWGGSDTLLYASAYLRDALGAERFDPPDLIRRQVEEGSGFYDQDEAELAGYRRDRIVRIREMAQQLTKEIDRARLP